MPILLAMAFNSPIIGWFATSSPLKIALFFSLSFSIFLSYFFGVALLPRRYFTSAFFSSHCDQDQQSKFIPTTISKHNTQLFQIG